MAEMGPANILAHVRKLIDEHADWMYVAVTWINEGEDD